MQTVVRTLLRATVYQLVRRLGLKYSVALGVAALALLVTVEGAWAATCSLYDGSSPDTDAGADDVEFGTRFTVDGEGASLTGARYYRHSSETGTTHTFTLWTGGTAVATATTSSETSSGWQSVDFAPDVALSDTATYTLSVRINARTGYSNGTAGYAACGPLTVTTGEIGLYNSTGGAHPSSVPSPTNQHYYIDPTVDYDTTPPPEEPVQGDAAALTWWGIWALVGLWFVGVIAPPMLSAMRVTRGMGA